MNALWKNKDAVQSYKMGEYDDESNDLPTQSIDFLWSKGGEDNIGYITSCDHTAKIEVHGKDCKEIAERIVHFLNSH